MTNEQRASCLIKRYGFDFDKIPKDEIIDLLHMEIKDYQPGSSEYIRLLCGYLYCLGDISDIPLLEEAKYSIKMEEGCKVDVEWSESLKNGAIEKSFFRSTQEINRSLVS